MKEKISNTYLRRTLPGQLVGLESGHVIMITLHDKLLNKSNDTWIIMFATESF